MRTKLLGLGFGIGLLAMPPIILAQEQQMPDMAMRALKAEYPRMGRALQKSDTKAFTLEDAEQLARQKNPTLRQAEAGIRAAKAQQQQAGLLPNPVVGYSGDEIRGGSSGGGKHGFFVEQRIVTGGKLRRAKDVAGKDATLAEIEAEEQKTRVETAVRMAFYRVLAAQELADARADLAQIAAENLEVQRRLANTGQADDTEILSAEIETHRKKISARMAENTLREEWRSLAAVLGVADLPLRVVSGDLEQGWPQLNEEEIVDTIAKGSPAMRIAEASSDRASAELARAKREAVPDVRLRAGLDYNNELLSGIPRPTGWEGSAEAAVELPVFNRNQGNVAAAAAEIDRAQAERERINLTLRERAASVVDEYANARLMASAYRDEILPRARKAYGLMTDRYGQMLASYPRVLETKQRLYELQVEYISALENVWSTGLALQGYLLTDGLESPARPSEMDRPVRETNVPMPERNMGPGGQGVPQP